MTIYQLVASGERAFTGEPSKLHSRRAFCTLADALNFRSKFERLCTTDLGKYDFERMSVVHSVAVAELELLPIVRAANE